VAHGAIASLTSGDVVGLVPVNPMFDATHPQQTEILEHHGYQICLTHAGLEWIAAVALPKQRPTLIMAPDREAAIARAYEWIELQLTFAKSRLWNNLTLNPSIEIAFCCLELRPLGASPFRSVVALNKQASNMSLIIGR
jgi:hypothetical protein